MNIAIKVFDRPNLDRNTQNVLGRLDYNTYVDDSYEFFEKLGAYEKRIYLCQVMGLKHNMTSEELIEIISRTII